MTTYSEIEAIEVALNDDDGSYRLQEVRIGDGGRVVLRTVSGVFSIADGLRQLANEIRRDAISEFARPRR